MVFKLLLLSTVLFLSLENLSDAKNISTKESQEKFKIFKDCENCPEMVVVPPGSFIFGENSRNKSSFKPIKINIPTPLAISRFEITWNEWLFCVKENYCKKIPSDHGWGKGRLPIINISWFDAKDYVAFLSKKSSLL